MGDGISDTTHPKGVLAWPGRHLLDLDQACGPARIELPPLGSQNRTARRAGPGEIRLPEAVDVADYSGTYAIPDVRRAQNLKVTSSQ
jgi:hypothetical protein